MAWGNVISRWLSLTVLTSDISDVKTHFREYASYMKITKFTVIMLQCTHRPRPYSHAQKWNLEFSSRLETWWQNHSTIYSIKCALVYLYISFFVLLTVISTWLVINQWLVFYEPEMDLQANSKWQPDATPCLEREEILVSIFFSISVQVMYIYPLCGKLRLSTRTRNFRSSCFLTELAAIAPHTPHSAVNLPRTGTWWRPWSTVTARRPWRTFSGTNYGVPWSSWSRTGTAESIRGTRSDVRTALKKNGDRFSMRSLWDWNGTITTTEINRFEYRDFSLSSAFHGNNLQRQYPHS